MRARTWFRIAALSLFAVPAWGDGELDTSFGNNGVVKIAFPNAPAGYLRDLAVVNGVIEAAGFYATLDATYLLVVQLSTAGSLIGAPVSYRLTAQTAGELSIDPATGDIYVVGDHSFRTNTEPFNHIDAVIQQFNASGVLLGTYTKADTECTSSGEQLGRTAVDSQGRLAAICDSGSAFALRSALFRLSGQGVNFDGPSFPFLHIPTVITQDPASGNYYFAGTNPLLAGTPCNSTVGVGVGAGRTLEAIGRLNVDTGALDTSYGIGGAAVPLCDVDGYVAGIAVGASGEIVIGGANTDTAYLSSGYLARLDPSGTPDATFGRHGVVVLRHLIEGIADVRVDRNRRIYALGAHGALVRFNVDGTPDVTFGSSSDVQTLSGPTPWESPKWRSLQFVDNSESSAYLIGGGSSQCKCDPIVAKVTLDSAVSAGTSVTVLNASSTTIPSGESVTLTATVIGTNPTGTVTFKDESTALRTAQLAAGSARFTTSSLAIGSHSLTATYDGDGRNAASSAQRVTEMVTPAISATALAASPAVINAGQSVTFTATVTGMEPTGAVTFSEGSTTLGTVSLSSGRATYSTSGLSVGNHTIVAAYSGDSANAPSFSASIVERVFDAPLSPSSGGSGSFAFLELCGILSLWLWRAFCRR
jgi:hypothetical protein